MKIINKTTVPAIISSFIKSDSSSPCHLFRFIIKSALSFSIKSNELLIHLLIQIGGLGVVTVAASFALLSG